MEWIQSFKESERYKRMTRWWSHRKYDVRKYSKEIHDGFKDKERWEMQFTPRRIFAFVFNFIWVVILWGSMIYKVFWDGVFSYIGYFTNWSWIYQSVFYLLYILSYLESPKTRGLEYWLLYAFWWNVFSQTIIIMVLVTVVFQDNAYILIGETKTGGGKYNDGTVLTYNFLVHYVPPFVALINMWVIWQDIADMLLFAFGLMEYHGGAPERCDSTRYTYVVRAVFAWMYIWLMTIFAILPILVYYNVFDIREVYHLEDFPTWGGVLITILLALLIVMLPLQYMFRSTIPSRPVPDYQRVHNTKGFDPESHATFQLVHIPRPSA